MKQILLYILMLALVSLFASSCTSHAVGRTNENIKDEYAIVVVDGKDILMKVKRDGRGNIVVDDSQLKQYNEVVETSNQTSDVKTKTNKDFSSITTMVDGYGNKVETRTFTEDSTVKQVVIRTFTNGNVKVFVYGINGEVRSVPTNFENQVLTASANEIASVAMIYRQRSDFDTDRNRPSSEKEQDTYVRQNSETVVDNQSSGGNVKQAEPRNVVEPNAPSVNPAPEIATSKPVDKSAQKIENKQPEK